MGKRRNMAAKRPVTAVSLKDAVQAAESVLSGSSSSVSGSGSGTDGVEASARKTKKKRKGKGGKKANTVLIRAHHTTNQRLEIARCRFSFGVWRGVARTV
jgi:hypothetical protein